MEDKGVSIDNNKDIFNFLVPMDNICISNLNVSDRINILFQLKKYYLEFRNKLGISDSITFGLEIEFEEALSNIINDELIGIFGYDKWCMVPEDSIKDGAEINSPVLIDNEKNWLDLVTVCDVVRRNACVKDNAGGHIHVGTQILGNNPKYWRNFALLWSTYENIIFRFLYGEFISNRSRISEFAMPVSANYIKDIDRIEDRAKMRSSSYIFKLFDLGDECVKLRRRKSVNFTNVSELQPYLYNMSVNMNTIEYRSANGTLDPIIWQNNVNFIVKLMLYCKSDSFNEEIIKNRMRQIVADDVPSNIYKYSYIYTEQALELADLIFDNNLDKVYFLRQYFKDGRVSRNSLVRSAKFTNR